ncbi:MAG: CoB--CoM heterodisulfide reductase iron-sulfur subunit A family protein, partial [Proteobacteria bacterium]|nr:CoB--CoM heterodisulfide reductase iron-sulfur subunit A family protein [Pseudomonadota bacterium]
DSCTGCGICMEKCPSKKATDFFNEGIGKTTAINIPFPQAIPKKAKIDPEFCTKLTKGKCGVCAKVCPSGCIDYEMKDEFVAEKVGAIVTATGYDLFDWSVYGEYGGGRYPDVITALQYERMLSASGPTGGHIKRPSDGKEPKNIVFIQCVGSRDKSVGRPYCTGFCCMYTAKQAILTKDHLPDSQSYVFYMDIRAVGKLYDEFTRRAMEEYDTKYIRGRVSMIYPKNDKLLVRGADTLMGAQVEVDADLVVLAVGAEAAAGASELAEKLRISYDSYGFYMEGHPKLKPVETNTAGVYLAGACQGPKDIPSSVAQGSAAAAKVLGLFSKDQLESDPQVSLVDIKRCIGCGKCIKTCPYGAIKETEFRGLIKANVIETICQGCGICTSTCPQGAVQLQHFTDNQILSEVNALCQF